MADHQQTLRHPALPGQTINLPACSEDTDEVYRNDGWVPVADKGTAKSSTSKEG